MEEACYMRMDAITVVSKSLELNQSGTSLLDENRHGYTWFALFGVETKCKKLVACEWTRLHMVPCVWSRNEVEQVRSNANGQCYACFLMFAGEAKWN